MKKSLFYVALSAAMLVGCSQDELDLVQDSSDVKVDLSERINIGKVDLGFNGMGTTRAIVNTDHSYRLGWEADDAIGAVLIDQVNWQAEGTSGEEDEDGVWKWLNPDESEKYGFHAYAEGQRILQVEGGVWYRDEDDEEGAEVTADPKFYYSPLSKEISSNERFVYNVNSGSFSSEITFVEGSYLFYTPFQPKMQKRDLVKVVFPMVQNAQNDDPADSRKGSWKTEKSADINVKALNQLFDGKTPGYEGAISHIGYKFLAHTTDGSTINATGDNAPTLQALYSMPTITIDYSDGIRLYSDNKSLKTNAPAKYTDELTIEAIRIYDNAPTATGKAAQVAAAQEALDAAQEALDAATEVDEPAEDASDEEKAAYAEYQALVNTKTNAETALETATNGRVDNIFDTAHLDNAKLMLLGTELWSKADRDLGVKSSYTSEVFSDKFGYAMTQVEGNLKFSENGNVIYQPKAAPGLSETVKLNSVLVKLDKTLTVGDKYHFNIALPAGDYGKGNLKAKVYVKTKEGTRYVLSLADVCQKAVGGTAVGQLASTVTSVADYIFKDPERTPDGRIILLRDWNIPACELNTGTSLSKKAFAGQMMTINLGLNETPSANTSINVVGFELKTIDEPAAETADGIKNNEEFIAHLKNNVGRGLDLREVPLATLAGKTKDKWSTKIAFAIPNTVVINAELVRQLRESCVDTNNTPDDGTAGTVLHLSTSNFPIAADVKVEPVFDIAEDTYRFTTVDGKVETSYLIEIPAAAEAELDKNGKAGAGITTLTEATEIKGAVKDAQAVIFLSGAEEGEDPIVYTLSGASDITRIILGDNANLVVETNCKAIIQAAGSSTITLNAEKGGKLTGANEFDGTITIINNGFMQANLGTVGENAEVTVTAEIEGFPEETIPANANINELTMTFAGNVEFTQAQANKLAGLSAGATVNVAGGKKLVVETEKVDVPATVEYFLTNDDVVFTTSRKVLTSVNFLGIKADDIATNVTVEIDTDAEEGAMQIVGKKQ